MHCTKAILLLVEKKPRGARNPSPQGQGHSGNWRGVRRERHGPGAVRDKGWESRTWWIGSRCATCALWWGGVIRDPGDFRCGSLLRGSAHPNGISTYTERRNQCQRGAEHIRQVLLGGCCAGSKLDPKGLKEIPERSAKETRFGHQKEGRGKYGGQFFRRSGGRREGEGVSLVDRDGHGLHRQGSAIAAVQVGNQDVGPFAHTPRKVCGGEVQGFRLEPTREENQSSRSTHEGTPHRVTGTE